MIGTMYVIYRNGKRICMQSGGEKFGGCDGALKEYIKFRLSIEDYVYEAEYTVELAIPYKDYLPLIGEEGYDDNKHKASLNKTK